MIKPYLNTFLAVCEAGSFTKAADNLFITPSAFIQQINALERDLSVKVFERNPRGVVLTAAGEYLFVHGKELVRKNKEIRQSLENLHSEEKVICVGTSLMEKCRLLYDLWVLFSENEKDYQIRMVNIEAGHIVPEGTDLVESVNGNMIWTRNWEFMEICQVPFGFAFQSSHPLAGKKKVTLDELRGETVISINKGTSREISAMLEELERNDIHVLYHEGMGSSILWECAFRGAILVAPVCWDDILINMHMSVCDWNYSMPYGFFYRPERSSTVDKFLNFIRQTYTSGNPQGIVPVLTEW